MLTSSQITQLSQSIEVLDVMDYYGIAYTAKGSDRYEALCPFHFEDTPSLKILTDRNIWTTFCCQKGHDAFAFIREMEPTFRDAIKVLKDLAKVNLEEDPLLSLESILEEVKDNTPQRIEALYYFVGIELRDWLDGRRSKDNYPELRRTVDKNFKEVDRFFQSEPTLEQAEKFYLKVLEGLKTDV